MQKKVLLLNLPGSKIYLRDQYCSHSSKAGYYWGALDLVQQSGIIAKDHIVSVIDAIGEKLSILETMDRIAKIYPDTIVALGGVCSIEEDLSFLEQCKSRFNCQQIAVGDIFYAYPERMLKYEFIDAVCLQYPAPELSQFISKERPLANMAYKLDKKIIIGEKKLTQNLNIPTPRHDLFRQIKCSFPFMRSEDCILVTTTFGCSNHCNYCSACNISYCERDLNNLFIELEQLKRDGISNIWFRDFTFTSNKKRAEAICRKMIELDLDFKWFCMTRSDTLDETLIKLMSQAGCYLILFGIETADSKILKSAKREDANLNSKEIFDLCKNNNIKVLCTIILGLPGDSVRSIIKTILFLCKLKVNFLSVNIFSPRCNTTFMKKLIDSEKLSELSLIADSSMCTKSFCDMGVFKLKVLRLFSYLFFYLRPANGFGLLVELFFPKKWWSIF